MKSISDREFALYRKLIYDESGILLTPANKALLEARLSRRLGESGMTSFLAYYDHVTADASGRELAHLLDRISTHQTHFFREPRQFEFVGRQLLPQWAEQGSAGRRPRRLRVWSAGCSTGEEPYSLAMTMLNYLHRGWHVEIVGTDLSFRAVDAARKAIWPIGRAKEIPQGYLKRFMLKGAGAQQANMKAGPELRAIVVFYQLNLNDERYRLDGIFDLIFCRNVMIYFDAAARRRVVQRLVHHLAPGGYLFVGHAESLNGISDRLRYVVPTVYNLAPALHSSRLAEAASP